MKNIKVYCGTQCYADLVIDNLRHIGYQVPDDFQLQYPSFIYARSNGHVYESVEDDSLFEEYVLPLEII